MYKYKYETVIKNINIDWLPFFEIKENKEELLTILDKLNKMDNVIYPNECDLFRALYYHSPKDIKVVILGQDCYISEENNIPQAMGLSFSVPKSHVKVPPSLINIYKEIKNCYPEYEIPSHGDLEKWAKDEKILLLNSSLTVNKGKSNSHASLWNGYTDKLIKWFQEVNPHCVFVLMGNFAKNKAKFINNNNNDVDDNNINNENENIYLKHKIFKTVHPSPLSAYNGFFGSGLFKNINEYLVSKNIDPIIW